MTIGEFSRETGVSASALRYYEDKGLIHVNRDYGNRRIYSSEDIEWVKFLQRLKNTGMSLKNMKIYSDLRYEGDSTIAKRLALLEKHQQYVDDQKALWDEYADNLAQKIEWYRRHLERQKSRNKCE